MVSEDGEKVSEEYDVIHFVTEYLGRLFYCARKGDELIIHREGKTTSIELTPEEQKKLDFLNLCKPLHHHQKGSNNPPLEAFQEKIAAYFQEKEKEEKQKNHRRTKLKNRLSNFHLGGINQMIRTYPQLFIDTLSPYKVRDPDYLADKMIQRMFPSVLQQEKSDFWSRFGR